MESPTRYSLLKKKFEIVCDISADGVVFVKAVKIAVVVGTVLNFINQGDVLISVDTANIAWGKLLLTYCIPFAVSTYTAISIGFQFKIGDPSPVDYAVRCSRCKNSIIALHKNELIPECENCALKTQWKLYAQGNN